MNVLCCCRDGNSQPFSLGRLTPSACLIHPLHHESASSASFEKTRSSQRHCSIRQPSSVRIMSSRPHFPPEIWGLTLHNLRERKGQDDLQYLWTEVRHVSKQFREEIEEIFRIEHLPKTWLHFDTRELIRFLFRLYP